MIHTKRSFVSNLDFLLAGLGALLRCDSLVGRATPRSPRLASHPNLTAKSPGYFLTSPKLRGLAFLLVLLFGNAAIADTADSGYMSYEGTAVDRKNGDVLYRESHFLALQGEKVRERLVLYRCADGKPFGRKRVAEVLSTPWLPEFDMTDARLGYREAVSSEGAALKIFVDQPDEEPEQETLAQVPADLVGDAGFDRFVQDQWDKLVAGETVYFHFLVPSRLDYLGFKVKQIAELQIEQRPARVFRLALGGLLGLIVSGIDVTYDAESRILLRFEGLSNMRDAEGENYVARIDFPPTARREEPNSAALEAARVVPLVSTCGAL